MEWQFLELPLFFSGERFYVGDLRWDVVARSTNSLLPSIGSLEILSGEAISAKLTLGILMVTSVRRVQQPCCIGNDCSKATEDLNSAI